MFKFPEQDDPLCRYLCANAGVAVLNVDYPVAPRAPFPVQPKVCFEIFKWAVANAAELGVNAAKPTIGGQSAGGSLTAAVARQALEAGGPEIALQILHYAVLDLAAKPGTKHVERTDGGKPVLPSWLSEFYHACYLPDRSLAVDPLASPAYGDNDRDLTGIAPALVITAENDVLRAEAVRYAASLERVGALREHRDVAGADHGYDIIGKDENPARDSYELMVEHLKAVHEN